MSSPLINVNGRFLCRTHTGVERVGMETLRAIEAVLLECNRDPNLDVTYVLPKRYAGVELPSDFRAMPKKHGRLLGQFWEQIDLAWFRNGGWLYNPCNLGPIFNRRSLTTIHDAQVYLIPEAYSFTFRFWYKTILPVLGRTTKIITTVSHYSKSMLEKYNVVPKGKANVIYNGCDHVHRVKSDQTILHKNNLLNKKYFFTIGSLSPHKNIDVLVNALSERKNKECPLVVAGNKMDKIFKNSKIAASDNVIYVGRVSDAELKALYENALCLLFPSLYEGFGLPPLEAMSCGCPVIASNTSSIPEICSDSVLYANPRDAKEWARQMDEVVISQHLCETLIEKGYLRSSEFTWRKSAIEILKLIAKHKGDRILHSSLESLKY